MISSHSVTSNTSTPLKRPSGYLARGRFRVFKKGVFKSEGFLLNAADIAFKMTPIFSATVVVGGNSKTGRKAKILKDRVTPYKKMKKYYATPEKQQKLLAVFLEKLKDIRYKFKVGNKKEVSRSIAGLLEDTESAADTAVLPLEIIEFISTSLSHSESLRSTLSFIDNIFLGFTDLLERVPLEFSSACLWAGVVAKSIGIPLAVISVVEKHNMLSNLETKLGLKGLKAFSSEAFDRLDTRVEIGLEYLVALKSLQRISSLKRAVVSNKDLDLEEVIKDFPDIDREDSIGEAASRLQFDNCILKRIRKGQVIRLDDFKRSGLGLLADSPEALGFRTFKTEDNSSYYIWDRSQMDISSLKPEVFARIIKSSRWRSSLKMLHPKDLIERIPLENFRRIIFDKPTNDIFNVKKGLDLKYKAGRLTGLMENPDFLTILECGGIKVAEKAGLITKSNRGLYGELFSLASVSVIDGLKGSTSWGDLKNDPSKFMLGLEEAIQIGVLKEVVKYDSPSSVFLEKFLVKLKNNKEVLSCLRGLLPDDNIKMLIDPQKLFELFNCGAVWDEKDLGSLKQEVLARRALKKGALINLLKGLKTRIRRDKNITISLHTINNLPELYLGQADKILKGIQTSSGGLKNIEIFRGKVLLESLRYRMGGIRNMAAIALSVNICSIGILLGTAVLGSTGFAVALLVVTVVPFVHKRRERFLIKNVDRVALSHDSIPNIIDRLKLYRKELSVAQKPRHRKALARRIKKLNREIENRIKFKSDKIRAQVLASY